MTSISQNEIVSIRFLQIGKAHIKNEIGFNLIAKEANAIIDKEYNPNILYDLVWIPTGFYHSSQIPNAKKLLFGPHNFVFPNEPWTLDIRFENSTYTCLSPWVKELYSNFKPLCMPVKAIPFPVEIERFKPDNTDKTLNCFVYYKGRDKKIYNYINQYLEENNISFVNIICGKYKEEEYIEILQKVKFGIWVGCHESQGFALEEALSMNVPLLVLNVKTIHDEVNSEGSHSYIEYKDNYDLKATSISYWDERCGEVIYDLNELKPTLEKIQTRSYNPREFILENLSPKVCYERLLQQCF